MQISRVKNRIAGSVIAYLVLVMVFSATVFTNSTVQAATKSSATSNHKVVGRGVVTSCNESAFSAALAGGGTITFNCGPNPVTISLTSEKAISADVTIDGGSKITLDGRGANRIFNISNGNVTLQNLTVANGYTTGVLQQDSNRSVSRYQKRRRRNLHRRRFAHR